MSEHPIPPTANNPLIESFAYPVTTMTTCNTVPPSNSQTSDIIEKIPGFRVIRSGFRATVVSALGALGECKATIVVDGVRVPYDFGLSIDEYAPSQLGAIEAYSGNLAMMAPPEFGNNACGVIAIWTRR